MNRIFSFIIIAIILFSCGQQKEKQIIELHSENGYGVFMPGRKIIFPNNDSIQYKGIPDELEEFVVRSMALQSDQYYWELYKKGKINKDQFLNIVSHYQIDTTKLSNIPLDYQVEIVIGTNQKGKRVIIIDSDNNEDFSNEKILEYEFPLSKEEQKEIDNTLPTIVTRYEFYENGNIIQKSINLKPSPYKGALGLGYNTENEIEKKYDLFISIPEHKTGEIELDKTKYNVFVSNGFAGVTFSPQRTAIFFSKSTAQTPSQLDGDIPYQIGDIFNSNGSDYLIESISLWGDTLSLKYIGENVQQTGITEGFFIPEFNAKKLDNSIFDLAQYPDKYVLIDFWGTWCNPCIKLIPELKQLNSDFKNKDFALVSVAFDKDVNKVIGYVEQEKMNWTHIFVDQNESNKNSLVEVFKVTSFPTTILVAPDGKIVARNKTMDELREILKNAL